MTDRNELAAGCVTIILVGVVGVVYGGWVVSVLWSWFVVPLFAVPALSVAQAIGLSIVIAVFTHQVQESETDGLWDAIGKSIGAALVTPTMYLAMGWIVQSFL